MAAVKCLIVAYNVPQFFAALQYFYQKVTDCTVFSATPQADWAYLYSVAPPSRLLNLKHDDCAGKDDVKLPPRNTNCLRDGTYV